MPHTDPIEKKEYQKQYDRQYRQKPEVINRRNMKITCECGGHYTAKMRFRHEKTNKHTEWLQLPEGKKFQDEKQIQEDKKREEKRLEKEKKIEEKKRLADKWGNIEPLF